MLLWMNVGYSNPQSSVWRVKRSKLRVRVFILVFFCKGIIAINVFIVKIQVFIKPGQIFEIASFLTNVLLLLSAAIVM